MITITFNDVPPTLCRKLEARAAAHGRTLEQEIVALLKSALLRAPADATTVEVQAADIREEMRLHLTQIELDEFRRSGRA